MNSSFSKSLLLSIVFHMAIILLFFGKIKLFPREDISLTNSIKVKVVSLPDKIAPQKPVKKKKPKKVVKKQPKTPKKKPSKKKAAKTQINKRKQESAFDKLKQRSAFDKLKGELTPPKEFKGNIINDGNDLTGLNKVRFHDYYKLFKDHLYENWQVPKWLEGGNYKAEATVKIDQQGNIVAKSLTKTSGNTVFDDSILTAIDNSTPFPPPPEAIKSVISRQIFKLGFPRAE